MRALPGLIFAILACAAARTAASESLPERLERVTRGLIGKPYALSPLGEGDGSPPDPDPRFRLDAFDCTTFVETAIALAREEDAARAAPLLDTIRYDAAPEFERRRHLIVGQWAQGLAALGFVADVTAEVGGADTQWVDFVLDAKRWKKRRIARALELPESAIPAGTYRVPFIPLEVVLARLDRVPPGTILNVVRKDVPWSPVLVTHQGLVVDTPAGGRVVRHASPVSKRVVDEKLEKMMRRYTRQRKWPVVGVNLLRVLEPRAN